MNAKGIVHKYGDNIDTDVIIPARHLNTQDHKELASHCTVSYTHLIIVTILSLFASYYTYLMMVSVRLTFWQILKNSYMFAFIGIRTNVLTLLFSTGVLVASILLIPYLSLIHI